MHKVIISFFFIVKCMQHARAILSFKFCATGGEEHPWKNSTTEELSIKKRKT